ncbi:MAG: glycosyltransferase family 4 protein [Chloroflexi bacterium]|nr:glycosyltransferase family 4 protein [Chloroflexota bacterium]
MTRICFVAPFRPITQSVAEYTSFITRELPPARWSVLSFDPSTCGASFIASHRLMKHDVWHSVPERTYDTISSIVYRLEPAESQNVVLWFQHPSCPWPNERQFVEMLKCLDIPKVITFHSLHFQSAETPMGLRKDEVALLEELLPHMEAMTVFNRGVYRAVISAFPEHRQKVRVLKHGVPIHTESLGLSRKEAKEKLHDFLLHEPDLDQQSKKALHDQRVLLDPDTFVIGETGFLSPMKQSDRLFLIRDILQRMTHPRKIVALRIGAPRDADQMSFADTLRLQQDQKAKLLLEIYLPDDMLPIAERAFDVNFCWPVECTGSRTITHILGAGGIIAGRDMEETGETLRESKAIAQKELGLLVASIRQLILNPEIGDRIESNAREYAARFSWENQAHEHCAFAEELAQMLETGTDRTLPIRYGGPAKPPSSRGGLLRV